jgi:hypothetical protein
MSGLISWGSHIFHPFSDLHHDDASRSFIFGNVRVSASFIAVAAVVSACMAWMMADVGSSWSHVLSCCCCVSTSSPWGPSCWEGRASLILGEAAPAATAAAAVDAAAGASAFLRGLPLGFLTPSSLVFLAVLTQPFGLGLFFEPFGRPLPLLTGGSSVLAVVAGDGPDGDVGVGEGTGARAGGVAGVAIEVEFSPLPLVCSASCRCAASLGSGVNSPLFSEVVLGDGSADEAASRKEQARPW